MNTYAGTFHSVISDLGYEMREAPRVEQHRWQGRDVRADPSARCYELGDVDVRVDLRGREDLDFWRRDIQPNLPWADDHFLERVGGQPLNPGKEWANWPWGKSADGFRRDDERFNHTYMERLWPRWARRNPGGTVSIPEEDEGRLGIDRRYGDLSDLIDLLVRDPYTRQAFIPLFFPEDTGWGDGGRKMCSLGYQFICRDGRLDLYYPLRSCDLARHFRDDCYLAVRMLLWILDRCRAADDFWLGVKPGRYTMHMTSLHVFENDRIKLIREYKV